LKIIIAFTLRLKDFGVRGSIHIDFAEGSHPLFALFLLFAQFLLARFIATVAFGSDVFAEGLDCLTGYDFTVE
jgi:hypothetical protein